LFKAIGNKFIDPNSVINDNTNEEELEIERIRKQTVKITTKDTPKDDKEKKKCC
jgi:hypothetical protein